MYGCMRPFQGPFLEIPASRSFCRRGRSSTAVVGGRRAQWAESEKPRCSAMQARPWRRCESRNVRFVGRFVNALFLRPVATSTHQASKARCEGYLRQDSCARTSSSWRIAVWSWHFTTWFIHDLLVMVQGLYNLRKHAWFSSRSFLSSVLLCRWFGRARRIDERGHKTHVALSS